MGAGGGGEKQMGEGLIWITCSISGLFWWICSVEAVVWLRYYRSLSSMAWASLSIGIARLALGRLM